MKSILLTGGNGFIGKNLLPALGARYRVLAPSRAELDLLDAVAVRAWFEAHPVDAIIHSVVQPGHRNAATVANQLERNCRMFFNVTRNVSASQRFLFLGSGAVYDLPRLPPKVDENFFDTWVPADEHGFSKYIAAKQIERHSNMVELRLFGVFGPHEDYAIRFISNAICKALCRLPITCRMNRRFDYLYVGDLAGILGRFIERGWGHPAYNVTPDQSMELVQIAELVREITGADVPIQVAEKGLGPEYSGANTRLRAQIPDLVLTPIRDAITRLVVWYRGNLHTIDRAKLLLDR